MIKCKSKPCRAGEAEFLCAHSNRETDFVSGCIDVCKRLWISINVVDRMSDAARDRISDVVRDRISDVTRDGMSNVARNRMSDVARNRMSDVVRDRMSDVVRDRISDVARRRSERQNERRDKRQNKRRDEKRDAQRAGVPVSGHLLWPLYGVSVRVMLRIQNACAVPAWRLGRPWHDPYFLGNPNRYPRATR
jgi:hypothetical protein